MKSLSRKCSVLVLTFLAGSAIYLVTASKHADYWKKDDRVRVYFNEVVSADSVIYRRADGMGVLNTAEDGQWYLLFEDRPLDHCSSFANHSLRFFTLQAAGYLYVWHFQEYPCAMFEPSNRVIMATSFEFNSRANARVRVTW